MNEATEITVVGEVLYDCFPDGQSVPGGAPFNVVWNLRGFGLHPRFISAVGEDTLGQKLLQLSQQWGIDCRDIEVIPSAPTSVVEVLLKDGIPSYRIVESTAMDALVAPELDVSESWGMLYHGSLAFRGEASMEMLRTLRGEWKGRVFVDINIRNPWFDLHRFESLIRGVEYLKINDEELSQIMEATVTEENLTSILTTFQKEFGIENVILTCGKQGAYWSSVSEGVYYSPAIQCGAMVDTIGAGDAFASVCLLGISRGWDLTSTLRKASLFAGRVCQLKGATTNNTAFYDL